MRVEGWGIHLYPISYQQNLEVERVGGEGGGLGHTLISYQLPAELRGGG